MIATMQVPKAIEAWCENLERYSDFQNRLPRGRTYLRNGSVIDLQIASGEVKALVCGSSVYQVAVKIMPVSKARWKSICKDCAGAIDQQSWSGFAEKRPDCSPRRRRFNFRAVVQTGLSCASTSPPYSTALVRASTRPELLFRLHQLDENELITKARAGLPLARKGAAPGNVLRSDDLAELFGLDLAQSRLPTAKLSPSTAGKSKRAKKKKM